MLLGFACDELACKPGSTAAPAIMVNSRRVMFMGGLESAGNPWRNSFSASLQHWVNKPVSSAQTWM
jgi:hypothetical protein